MRKRRCAILLSREPADADTDEMIREIGGEMLRTLMPKCVYKDTT